MCFHRRDGMVEKNPNITVHREEVTALDESVPVLVASGPLTEGALAEQIAALTGSHRLSFFDAVAPIVSAESLDMERSLRRPATGAVKPIT